MVRKKMAVPVERVPVNVFKVFLASLTAFLILWFVPLLLGKYTDVTYPYIARKDIIYELVGLIGDAGKGIRWCPPISPYIEETVHLIDVEFDSLIEEELVKKYKIQPGGSWKPQECLSRYQVTIVVPYRNRSQQLRQFLTYMHPYLIRQQLDYRIVVVEQSNVTTFNRAKLFNIGFVESLKMATVDCFVFHDVDLLPQNDMNIYACTHHPRHMYSALDKFRYHLPYRNLFGGAIAVQRVHFSAVNGFANRYYGWGGEDDDFYSRIERKGLTIIRFDPQVALYVMLPHQSLPPSEDRFLHLNEGVSKSDDGLATLSYQLIEKKVLPLYTLILVSC
ncbi:beta-1,4-galactosyltransferase 1-like [Macrobrachium nipponense]|uniref:beta-1,4-galactosyltransferase 1-like n=1 Tax=Macrobrachium nipponense TaxID=159736 RepID=UPI0030C7BAE0